MTRLRRLVAGTGGALVIAIVTVVGANAAGFLGAGHFSINQADASGFWTTDPTGQFGVNVFVSRSTFLFRPRGGGAPFTQHATVVNLEAFEPTFNGFGCFVIPDSQFVISNDLQTTTLNTTLTADESCPGSATPMASVGKAAPFAGGGGPPPGLPLPIGVHITWIGPGSAFVMTNAGQVHCSGVTSTSQENGAFSQATGSGSLSLPDGTTILLAPTFTTVDSFTIIMDVNGQPGPQCIVT